MKFYHIFEDMLQTELLFVCLFSKLMSFEQQRLKNTIVTHVLFFMGFTHWWWNGRTFGLESENLCPFFSRVKFFLMTSQLICFWPRALGGVWSTLAEAERNNGVKKNWRGIMIVIFLSRHLIDYQLFAYDSYLNSRQNPILHYNIVTHLIF